MADYIIERRLWLPRPRSDVFAFFVDPRNLGAVQPGWAQPIWLAEPPARLEAGALLDFAVRMAGVSVRWRVMVREFDPPFRFVDVQLWGPFARWEHRHRFLEGPESDGQGPVGTWMEDRVTYRLPWGPLGRAAHALGAGEPREWQRGVEAFHDELERAEALGLPFVIIHPGSHRGEGLEAGVTRIGRALDLALERTRGYRVMVLLENTAGGGATIGRSFEEL